MKKFVPKNFTTKDSKKAQSKNSKSSSSSRDKKSINEEKKSRGNHNNADFQIIHAYDLNPPQTKQSGISDNREVHTSSPKFTFHFTPSFPSPSVKQPNHTHHILNPTEKRASLPLLDDSHYYYAISELENLYLLKNYTKLNCRLHQSSISELSQDSYQHVCHQFQRHQYQHPIIELQLPEINALPEISPKSIKSKISTHIYQSPQIATPAPASNSADNVCKRNSFDIENHDNLLRRAFKTKKLLTNTTESTTTDDVFRHRSASNVTTMSPMNVSPSLHNANLSMPSIGCSSDLNSSWSLIEHQSHLDGTECAAETHINRSGFTRAHGEHEGHTNSSNEQSIIGARASVMVYDDIQKKWIPSGSSSGLSKVQIYHHQQNNTFRVVGRKLQDHEVVINCSILKGLKYNQATATFHQWRDSKFVYGLNFSSQHDAEAFARAMMRALEVLSGRATNTTGQPNNGNSYEEDMGYRTMTSEDAAILRQQQQITGQVTPSAQTPTSQANQNNIPQSPPTPQQGHHRTSRTSLSAPPAPQPQQMSMPPSQQQQQQHQQTHQQQSQQQHQQQQQQQHHQPLQLYAQVGSASTQNGIMLQQQHQPHQSQHQQQQQQQQPQQQQQQPQMAPMSAGQAGQYHAPQQMQQQQQQLPLPPPQQQQQQQHQSQHQPQQQLTSQHHGVYSSQQLISNSYQQHQQQLQQQPNQYHQPHYTLSSSNSNINLNQYSQQAAGAGAGAPGTAVAQSQPPIPPHHQQNIISGSGVGSIYVSNQLPQPPQGIPSSASSNSVVYASQQQMVLVGGAGSGVVPPPIPPQPPQPPSQQNGPSIPPQQSSSGIGANAALLYGQTNGPSQQTQIENAYGKAPVPPSIIAASNNVVNGGSCAPAPPPPLNRMSSIGTANISAPVAPPPPPAFGGGGTPSIASQIFNGNSGTGNSPQPPAPPAPPTIGPVAPPPPPPPPLLSSSAAKKDEQAAELMGSLALQLQMAKLKKNKSVPLPTENSGSSTSSGGSGNYGTIGRSSNGMASMMDEMAKTLARRRAQAEKKEPEPEPEVKQRPWEKSNTLPHKLGGSNSGSANSNSRDNNSNSGSESPRPIRKRFGSASEETILKQVNGDGLSLALASGDLDSLKAEIVREMRLEIQKVKQEIIDAIKSEFNRR